MQTQTFLFPSLPPCPRKLLTDRIYWRNDASVLAIRGKMRVRANPESNAEVKLQKDTIIEHGRSREPLQ